MVMHICKKSTFSYIQIGLAWDLWPYEQTQIAPLAMGEVIKAAEQTNIQGRCNKELKICWVFTRLQFDRIYHILKWKKVLLGCIAVTYTQNTNIFLPVAFVNILVVQKQNS